ncbi:MAG: pyrroline-5-carboxylate reductase [Candidatus Komeilibacteria bacterium]|nr:pyrroline-5-carboxylate reductase [Candidatus Komeilibacteria bacterium]
MKSNLRLGFIGSGKMAEAIISGLLRKKLIKPKKIIACGPQELRAKDLQKRFRVKAMIDNLSAVESEIVILSVKPQSMARVCRQIKGKIAVESLVISIAAGIPLEFLKAELEHDRIVRAMPNTPGSIGKGITGWTCTPEVSAEQKSQVANLLESLGVQIFMDDEKKLDMVTAVSGTGPAYVFLFMEAFINAAVEIGLSRDEAKQLVLETIIGSAEYIKEFPQKHLAHLRDEVTSPAGTTAAALYELEKAGFRTAIADAINAAYQRSIKLGGK